MNHQRTIRFENSESRQFRLDRPYDLFGTLRFARFGQYDPTFRLSNSRLLTSIWLQGVPYVVDARRNEPGLLVKVYGPPSQSIWHAVEEFFGIHRPFQYPSGHDLLDTLTGRHPGLHNHATPNLTYALVKTVLQQLIEWRDAATIWRRWILTEGIQCTTFPELRLAPPYGRIAKTPDTVFQTFGLAIQRAKVVRELGRLGERIDDWRLMPVRELRKQLHKISGISTWTVEHCLGFGLAAPDAVPTGDFQLPHTVAYALTGKHRSDDAEMLELLEPWRGQRWSVLRLLFAAQIRAPRKGPRLNKGRPARPDLRYHSRA